MGQLLLRDLQKKAKKVTNIEKKKRKKYNGNCFINNFNDTFFSRLGMPVFMCMNWSLGGGGQIPELSDGMGLGLIMKNLENGERKENKSQEMSSKIQNLFNW